MEEEKTRLAEHYVRDIFSCNRIISYGHLAVCKDKRMSMAKEYRLEKGRISSFSECQSGCYYPFCAFPESACGRAYTAACC